MLAPRHRQPLRRALGKVSLIDQTIRRLRRSDEIAQLQASVAELQATIAQLQVERRGDPLAAGPAVSVLVPSTAAPFLTEVPPGHFY